MWSNFNGYMCNLLYMKPMRCNALPKIYLYLEDGSRRGQSAMGICEFCYI